MLQNKKLKFIIKGEITMFKQFTEEEIAKAEKNPFFEKICRSVPVPVNHRDYEVFEKIAKAYEITPERVMQTTLAKYARLMRDEDFN